jgi:hypothetical protein
MASSHRQFLFINGYKTGAPNFHAAKNYLTSQTSDSHARNFVFLELFFLWREHFFLPVTTHPRSKTIYVAIHF